MADMVILHINAVLDNISRWSAKNSLKLNVGKCTTRILHLGPSNIFKTLGNAVLTGESLAECNMVKIRYCA